MPCPSKCARGEYPCHVWERNATEIQGKGHREFEKFRKTLVTCVRKEWGNFVNKGAARIFKKKVEQC